MIFENRNQAQNFAAAIRGLKNRNCKVRGQGLCQVLNATAEWITFHGVQDNAGRRGLWVVALELKHPRKNRGRLVLSRFLVSTRAITGLDRQGTWISSMTS